MDKKDSERIYHIERKVDRILEILEKQQQGYVFPGVSKEPCHCPGHPVFEPPADNLRYDSLGPQ